MIWKKANPLLIVLPLILSSLGLVTLLSTSPELAKDQAVFFLIGCLLYFLVVSTDYRVWRHFSSPIFFGSIILLLIVFVAGKTIFGSTRWLQIGGFSIQPSEFVKVSLVLFLSDILAKNKLSVRVFLYIFVAFALVFIQPDLGTSVVLLVAVTGILWMGGLNKVYFLAAAALFGIFSSPAWNFLKPYQKERILVFLNPRLDTLGAGYNVIQSTIAVGSGGMWGKGFGQGTQSHLQFLPVYWTDFIFAAFAEEWGFVGSVVIIATYIALLLALLYISIKIKDSFSALLTTGVFLVFFSQFAVNVGMNLGMLPVTGIPLPLVSYGGSSFLVSMILLGLVQSVWINRSN